MRPDRVVPLDAIAGAEADWLSHTHNRTSRLWVGIVLIIIIVSMIIRLTLRSTITCTSQVAHKGETRRIGCASL